MSYAFNSLAAVDSIERWLGAEGARLATGENENLRRTLSQSRELRRKFAVAVVSAAIVDRADTEAQLSEALVNFLLDPRRAINLPVAELLRASHSRYPERTRTLAAKLAGLLLASVPPER